MSLLLDYGDDRQGTRQPRDRTFVCAASPFPPTEALYCWIKVCPPPDSVSRLNLSPYLREMAPTDLSVTTPRPDGVRRPHHTMVA